MRVVVFGEGMIEEQADAAVAWGGDVVNTAVYLARQGATPLLESSDFHTARKEAPDEPFPSIPARRRTLARGLVWRRHVARHRARGQ